MNMERAIYLYYNELFYSIGKLRFFANQAIRDQELGEARNEELEKALRAETDLLVQDSLAVRKCNINPLGRLLYSRLVLESWICYSRTRRPRQLRVLPLRKGREPRPVPARPEPRAWLPLPDCLEYADWPRSLL